MAKVTSSANKEKSTNSYAKNNQAAIKALKAVGKITLVGAAISAAKGVKEQYQKHKEKKQKQKDMEAVDV